MRGLRVRDALTIAALLLPGAGFAATCDANSTAYSVSEIAMGTDGDFENSVFQVQSIVDDVERWGSAFFVTEDYAVTAAHNVVSKGVEDPAGIDVKAWLLWEPDAPVAAQVVAFDNEKDVALLKVEAGTTDRRGLPLMLRYRFEPGEVALLGFGAEKMTDGPLTLNPNAGKYAQSGTAESIVFDKPIKGDSGGAILYDDPDVVFGLHIGKTNRTGRTTDFTKMIEVERWLVRTIITADKEFTNYLIDRLGPNGREADFRPGRCKHPDCWDDLELSIAGQLLLDLVDADSKGFTAPPMMACALEVARKRGLSPTSDRFTIIENRKRFAASGRPKNTAVASPAEDIGGDALQELKEEHAQAVAQAQGEEISLASDVAAFAARYLEVETLYADAAIAEVAENWSRASEKFCVDGADPRSAASSFAALANLSGAQFRMPDTVDVTALPAPSNRCGSTYFNDVAARRFHDAADSILFRIDNDIVVQNDDPARASAFFAAAAALTSNDGERRRALSSYVKLAAGVDAELAASALTQLADEGVARASLRSDYAFVRAIDPDEQMDELLPPSFDQFKAQGGGLGLGGMIAATPEAFTGGGGFTGFSGGGGF